MARKQFVSSKKNAPSRAVSSKEAALHGRVGGAAASDAAPSGDDDDDDDDDDGASDSDSGSNSPGSPASSNGSSLFTSDELDDEARGVADDATELSAAPVAVEVVPSSVGRGKQLRFPTVISRGKESRVFAQDSSGAMRDDSDGSDNSDNSVDDDDDGTGTRGGGAGSDSDSLLSLASDEEDDRSSVDGGGAATSADDSSSAYPIKGARARKRHRPDSGYYKHMATYVRDCLLSVRDGGPDVLSDAAHDAFRRKLSAGGVERVTWKESPASVDDAAATGASSETRREPQVAAAGETTSSSSSRAEKPRKEHRTKEKRSESSRRRDEPAATATSATAPSSSSRMKDAGAVDSAVRRDEPKPKSDATEPDRRRTNSSSSKTDEPRRSPAEFTDRRSSSSATVATVAQTNGDVRKPSSVVTAAATPTSAAPAPAALCMSCKCKLSDVHEPEKLPTAKKSVTIVVPESRAPAPTAAAPAVEPQGAFLIPAAASRDVARLRADASRLLEEARALKHEGNRRGSAESGGTAAQIAQGKCYLRSSAKFFQHALKYADLKTAYKDAGDERHARTCGDYCVTTLTQTTSLIESTVRTMQSAGSKRMVALGCKLAAVLHLAIYRLQHLKLFSLYSDLFTPGRSPDTRPTGTPPVPPGASAGGDSKEAAVRAHLLKEMEHTLRGFDMWRRYEACRVVVLPRISNPATTDLAVLFEELENELGSS